MDGDGEEAEDAAALPGLDGCLAEMKLLVEGELGGLAEPSSALLNRAREGLFPCMDEEMLLEVLLACEVLETDLARVGLDV